MASHRAKSLNIRFAASGYGNALARRTRFVLALTISLFALAAGSQAASAAAPTITFNPAGDIYTYQTAEYGVFFSIPRAGLNTSSVQCSVDGGSFGACDNFDGSSDPDYGYGDMLILGPLATGEHSVTVRADDGSGNVGTATQRVFVRSSEDGPISLTVTSTSTRAGRHPDLMLDLVNETNEDISSMSSSMPVGFAGSLNAVSSDPRCPYPDDSMFDTSDPPTDAEVDSWCDQSTRDGSQVGTTFIEGKVDGSQSTTRLYGKVYLTDSYTQTHGGSPAEAAALVVVVPAQVDALDLGNVLIGVRVSARQKDPSIDVHRSPEGVDTTISEIPSSITSAHGTTEFTMERTRLWLHSKFDPSYPQPLITNPSSCESDTDFKPHRFLTMIQTEGGQYHELKQSYEATDCADQPFDANVSLTFIEPINPASPPPVYPTTFTPLSSPPSPNQIVGVRMTMTMPPGSTTLKRARFDLPASIVNENSAVDPTCSNGSSGAQKTPVPNCNSTDHKIGTFTVNSPLLITPLSGTIYKVDSGYAIPYVYLFARDTSLGVEVRVRMRTEAFMQPHPLLRTKVNVLPSGGDVDLPDLPVSGITANIAGSMNQGSFVRITTPDVCSNEDSGSYYLLGHNGKAAVGTLPIETANCTQSLEFTPTSGFSGGGSTGHGGVTSDITPTFNFGVTAKPGETLMTTPTYECAIDDPVAGAGLPSGSSSPTYQIPPTYFNWASGGACPGAGATGSYTSSALTDGVHTLGVRSTFDVLKDCDGNPLTADTVCTVTEERHATFEVDTASAADTTAPVVTIDSGPTGTISDASPTFAFSAAEPVDFHCRVDELHSFEPCGTNSTSGSFTPPEDLFNGNHTFEVRGEDGVGNVGASQQRSFDLDPPFGPLYTITPSTYKARAHPTLEVEIGSRSDEDLRSIAFKMPTGFVGSLLGAAERCSAAAAATNNCPTSSRVGTLEATAQADFSDVVQDGEVFLTEPLVAGDPAGMLVKVDPSVGAIDADNVNPIGVRARLVVRGNAEGVDVVPLDDVPREVEVHTASPPTSVMVSFHFRSMKLNLTGGVGASQPLLTNPSQCSLSSFDATFKSWDATETSVSQGFQATDCESLPFYVGFASNLTSLADGDVPTAGETTRFSGTVATSPDDAGIRHSRMELPRSLSADPSGLPLGCSFEVYQATKVCDKGDSAVIGSAVVNTPLLPGPLYGKVYLGQPDPNGFVDEPIYSETLRLIVQMRGLVSIDLVGRTILKDYQSITVFENIPDAPVNSFNVVIDKLVRVRPTACSKYKNDRAITGVSTAHNGKTSPISNDVSIACRGSISTAKVALSGKGKRGKANVTAVAGDGARFRSLKVRFPAGIKLVKKQLKKKLVVIADGKRVKKPCFKATTRELNLKLCGKVKTARTLNLRFGVGSLFVVKKPKKPGFDISATFDTGESDKRKIVLRKGK